jgi:putative hydrolase of the HAD superfamily
MKFDAVLADAAETLFTTRGSVGEIYSTIARGFGSTATPAEIQDAFTKHFPHSGPLSSSGEKQWWKELVSRVFSDVGMLDNFDRFFDEVYDLFRDSRGWILFPETREVLAALHGHGLKIGVISNFDSRLYSVLKDLGIDTLLDSVTICSEVGYAKPQPQIFHAALRTLGVPAERVLFTGDSLVDDATPPCDRFSESRVSANSFPSPASLQTVDLNGGLDEIVCTKVRSPL